MWLMMLSFVMGLLVILLLLGHLLYRLEVDAFVGFLEGFGFLLREGFGLGWVGWVEGRYFEVIPCEGRQVEFGFGVDFGEDDFLELHSIKLIDVKCALSAMSVNMGMSSKEDMDEVCGQLSFLMDSCSSVSLNCSNIFLTFLYFSIQ